MSHLHLATSAGLAREAMEHTRHQPEKTLLYQVIEQYYPELLSHLSQADKTLPQYVQTEFEEYLKCGRLEHGFLRVQCESSYKDNWSHSVASAAVFARAVVLSCFFRLRSPIDLFCKSRKQQWLAQPLSLNISLIIAVYNIH